MVNPNYVKQTLGRHKLFTHGIKGVSDAAKDRYRNKEKALQEQPRKSEEEEATPSKRPYTKKSKSMPAVNFCPGCGCNLLAVAAAMTLR